MFMFLLVLTSTDWTEEMNQRKKMEPQSHAYLLHNLHKPRVVWRCLPARVNSQIELQMNFVLDWFEMLPHQFVHLFRLKYIGGFMLKNGYAVAVVSAVN